MKIPELAKKLEISPRDLKVYAQKVGFDLGRKSRTLKDKAALDLEEKVRHLIEEEEKNRQEQAPKPNIKEEKIEKIYIPEVISVKEFSAKINQPVTSVIKTLMKNGVVATINENIDFASALVVADELGVEISEASKQVEKKEVSVSDNKEKLESRPPIVVVLGHVDHGKTTLLDKIRETNVAKGESGGITQHIGSYQVEVSDKDEKKRLITFLDTPGHEAFGAMRAHGTKITDLAILVVAANDGVKPQTKEAIAHAKAAGVPIIVAITKIDMPGADIEKTKKELSEQGLAPEEWGGSTPMILVSGKTGENIDELLEIILLESDLEELKADFHGPAIGVVVESKLDKKVGPVATVLIQKGTLHTKDIILAGESFGRIKAMTDFHGKALEEATPSMPVKIAGLNKVPNFGEKLEAVENEKEAKNRVLQFTNEGKKSFETKKVQTAGDESSKKLPIIIKSDVAGSLKAISESLAKIGNDEVGTEIISQNVGEISESDIMDARALGAMVVGFKVYPTTAAKQLATQLGVKIATYEIIYDLIENIKKTLSDMLEKEKVRVEKAQGRILKIFAWEKRDKLIGVKVQTGTVTKSLIFSKKVEDNLEGEGKILSMKIEKAKVEEAHKGDEVGLIVDINIKLSEGDKLVFYQIEEKSRTL